MNTTDYENIWQKSLIHVTDEFALPPVVLQAGEAIITRVRDKKRLEKVGNLVKNSYLYR